MPHPSLQPFYYTVERMSLSLSLKNAFARVACLGGEGGSVGPQTHRQSLKSDDDGLAACPPPLTGASNSLAREIVRVRVFEVKCKKSFFCGKLLRSRRERFSDKCHLGISLLPVFSYITLLPLFSLVGTNFFAPVIPAPTFFSTEALRRTKWASSPTVKLTEIFPPSGMHISPFLGRRKDEEKVLLSVYTDGLGFHLTARL